MIYAIFYGIISFLLFSELNAEANPQVVAFQPTGSAVELPSQVILQFSEDMIPLGSPSKNAKILESNCLQYGNYRWLDSKTWVLDFKKPLSAGKKCKFTLHSNLVSLSGKQVQGKKEFEFSTIPIRIIQIIPYENSVIQEDQVFVLYLNGEISPDEVLKNSYIITNKTKDKIELQLVDNQEIKELLQKEYSYFMNQDQWIPVIVKPKTKLIESAKVQLVLSGNLQSKDGISLGYNQNFHFTVRDKFLATVHCSRESAQKHCIPLDTIILKFSAPISQSVAKKIYLQGPNDKKIYPSPLYLENTNLIDEVVFEPPFLENANYKIFIPDGIQDDVGRELTNSKSFPMDVKTDRYPPLAKFSAHFNVLESKASPILPITIRKLESQTNGNLLYYQPEKLDAKKISEWLSKVRNSFHDSSVFKDSKETILPLQLPKLTQDGSMEVVGIPLLRNGFFVVEVRSKVLGKYLLENEGEYFVPTVALVTNLAVHLKKGENNTLVWVTELSTGKPVSGADVVISDCEGVVYAQGKTNADGVFLHKGKMSESPKYCGIGGIYSEGYFAIAKTQNDVSFVHSSWNEGIEPWRFRIPSYYENTNTLYHLFLDRTLFKRSEKVSMKFYARRYSDTGFIQPSPNSLYKNVILRHQGSGTNYPLTVQWEPTAHASLSWNIPKNAYLGSYQVYLSDNPDEVYGGSYLGEFRVEEFRLPILKASIQSEKSSWIAKDKIPITLQANFLAGGSASNLPVTFRYQIQPGEYFNKEYPNYIFNRKPVKPGKSSYGRNEQPVKFKSTQLVLDNQGLANVLVDWEEKDVYSELQMEMEFKDPSGEIQSVGSKLSLFPTDILVGIDDNYEVSKNNTIKLKTIVLDVSGKPKKEIPLEVYAFESKEYIHRKRLVGGFYSYEYYTQISPIGKVCEGKSGSDGTWTCNTSEIKKTQEIILEVRAKTKSGPIVYSNIRIWIPSKDNWWYSATDSDRMDILPDKRLYKVGETAKIKIESPFASYSALITVERDGVIDYFVKAMEGKNPSIDLPILKSYSPNVYVSTLAIRGRLDSPKETSLVDLARPTFKYGLTELKVGWEPHLLDVRVISDKKEYKPRSKGELTIEVSHQGKRVSGGEVAVAIVDEALLELSGNNTTKLIQTMMQQRNLKTITATLQMHVIGKRHFGKKALPVGGGGGRAPTRELFDTLVLWNPSVKLDSKGEARVPFELKDSLTQYRALVVATSRMDLFGDGETKFQSNQEVLVFSGLPPVARTGDVLIHEFTIKNNTESPKEITMKLKAWGTNGEEKFEDKTFVLNPNSSEKVKWNGKIGSKPGERFLQLDIFYNNQLQDSLKIRQKLEESTPVRVTQGTVYRLDEGKMNLPIQLPKEAQLEGAGIRLTVAPTIIASTEGIQTYMDRYPFSCFEQQFSKAIVKEDSKEREKILNELPSYLDIDGLLKFFPNLQWGDEVLTSYVLILASEANWKLSNETKEKMLTGLGKYLNGNLSRRSYSYFNDSLIRKILVLDAMSRYQSVDLSILGTEIQPNQLPNTSLIQYIQILERTKTPNSSNQISNAKKVLNSRLDYQGTELQLRDKTGELWWMMGSKDLDRAMFMLYVAGRPEYKSDIAKLIHSYSRSMRKSYFDTTLANSFGYLAFKKLARTYEKDPLSGKTAFQFGNVSRSISWEENPANQKPHFSILPISNKSLETLQVQHEGSGAPWVFVSTEAKYPIQKPITNGVFVEKTMKPIQQKVKGKYSVGDIYLVTLKWKLSAPRTWFVVSDPIPTGSLVLGSGLGRDSSLLSSQSIQEDSYWISFIERSFTHYRAYFEYLPEGEFTLEYTLRLNQAGTYQMPPSRWEAMYSPDIYGEFPNSEWVIGE